MLDSVNSSGAGLSNKGNDNESQDNLGAADGNDDNYKAAGIDDDEDEEDGFLNMQRPTSWGELFSMIFKQNEERLLTLQNPDGLLYLTYLKQSALFFFISKFVF